MLDRLTYKLRGVVYQGPGYAKRYAAHHSELAARDVKIVHWNHGPREKKWIRLDPPLKDYGKRNRERVEREINQGQRHEREGTQAGHHETEKAREKSNRESETDYWHLPLVQAPWTSPTQPIKIQDGSSAQSRQKAHAKEAKTFVPFVQSQHKASERGDDM